MKKFYFAAAVVAVAALASCSTDRSKVDAVDPQIIVEKIKICNDPDSIKLYVDAAEKYASKLAYENKLDSAQQYLAVVMPEVEKKDPKLVEKFKSVEGVITSAVDSTKTRTGEIADSVAAKGGELVEQGKEAVTDAASAVGNKAGEVKDAAVEKGSEVVAKGKEAVKDGASKVTDAAKDGAKKVDDAASDAVDKAKNLF